MLFLAQKCHQKQFSLWLDPRNWLDPRLFENRDFSPLYGDFHEKYIKSQFPYFISIFTHRKQLETIFHLFFLIGKWFLACLDTQNLVFRSMYAFSLKTPVQNRFSSKSIFSKKKAFLMRFFFHIRVFNSGNYDFKAVLSRYHMKKLEF